MRRVIFAIVATVAGLVALLSFKSHSPAAVTTPGGATEAGGTAAGGTAAGGTAAGGTAAGGATGSGFATKAKPPSGARTIDGSVASTIYGPVKVQVVVKNSKIVGVNILEQPSGTSEDLQIGQFAFPQLINETVSAQSAHVDAVSGASYTSAGYIKSLQSALDNGA